jgi:hypothetical protein
MDTTQDPEFQRLLERLEAVVARVNDPAEWAQPIRSEDQRDPMDEYRAVVQDLGDYVWRLTKRHDRSR